MIAPGQEVAFAEDDQGVLWGEFRSLIPGLSPSVQEALKVLAGMGRTGLFSLWPNPPGLDPERNRMFLQKGAPGIGTP